MGHKKRLSLIKWVSAISTAIGIIIGILSVDWGAVARFGHASVFLYDNVEEVEHLVEDQHLVFDMNQDIVGLHKIIDSLEHKQDSLEHIVRLFNRGKLPYDSIWRKSESGHWYLTTVENHINNEHEN